MYIDKYKQFDIVEDCIKFFKKMQELKPYMVEFNQNCTMKPKVYSPNYVIEGENK